MLSDGSPTRFRQPSWSRPFADAMRMEWRASQEHMAGVTADAVAARACPCYLVAWVSDDPADDDGDPARDAPAGVSGHGVLLVRGAAVAEATAIGVKSEIGKIGASLHALEFEPPRMQVEMRRLVLGITVA